MLSGSSFTVGEVEDDMEALKAFLEGGYSLPVPVVGLLNSSTNFSRIILPRIHCINSLWADYLHLWLICLLRFAYIRSVFPLTLCKVFIVLALHLSILVFFFCGF